MDDDLDPGKAFRDQSAKAQQILFREREVDNLMNMIYGASATMDTASDDDDFDDDDGGALDSNRFDVAAGKLAMYKRPVVKRKLKSKFVTGQSSDQIV